MFSDVFGLPYRLASLLIIIFTVHFRLMYSKIVVFPLCCRIFLFKAYCRIYNKVLYFLLPSRSLFSDGFSDELSLTKVTFLLSCETSFTFRTLATILVISAFALLSYHVNLTSARLKKGTAQ